MYGGCIAHIDPQGRLSPVRNFQLLQRNLQALMVRWSDPSGVPGLRITVHNTHFVMLLEWVELLLGDLQLFDIVQMAGARHHLFEVSRLNH
jgi:hypothetical protein